MEICKTPDCGEEVKCLGLCANCYNYILRWNHRDVEEQMERLGQLEMWRTRFFMLGTPTQIKAKKIPSKSLLKVMPGEADQPPRVTNIKRAAAG